VREKADLIVEEPHVAQVFDRVFGIAPVVKNSDNSRSIGKVNHESELLLAGGVM
jgi:hypothetical protein